MSCCLKAYIISTDQGYRLPAAFLETLAQRNFWWSAYLIVDQQAFSSLLEPTEKRSSEARNQSIQAQAELPNNPEAVIDQDTQLFQAACNKVAKEATDFDWQSIRKLIPQHINIDLDIDLIMNEWISSLEINKTLLCNFPLETVTP